MKDSCSKADEGIPFVDAQGNSLYCFHNILNIRSENFEVIVQAPKKQSIPLETMLQFFLVIFRFCLRCS